MIRNKFILRLKKGANMIEFLIVIPIVILALNAVVYAGVMAYSKVAAQSVSYSATVSAARYGLDPIFSENIGTWAEIPYQPLWDHIEEHQKCNNTRVLGGCSAFVQIVPSKFSNLPSLTVNDNSYFMFSPFISDNAGVFGKN